MAQKYGLPTTSTNTPVSSPEQQQFHKVYAQQQATQPQQTLKMPVQGSFTPVSSPTQLQRGDSTATRMFGDLARIYATGQNQTPINPELLQAQQQFQHVQSQQDQLSQPMTMPVQGSFTPVSQPQPIKMMSATSTPQTVQTSVAPNSTPIATAQAQAKTTATATPAKSPTPAPTPTNSTYKVVSGDNLSAIAKKYGTTVDALLKLNPNIKNANSISVGQSINVGKSTGSTPASGGSKGWTPPKDYSNLQTPEQLLEYAKKQAQSKYDNEALGIQQLIDQYNLQMSQLAKDADIQAQAKRMTDLKYADALTGIETSRNDAQSQYQGNLQNLQNQYNQGTGELHNNAFQQRQRSLEEMYARGLGMSTVLDQRQGMIDKSEQDGITKLTSDLNNNVATLDREIGTLMTNLDLQKTSLTKQQQTELVGMIQDKMKERDTEKAKLQQLINQQGQLKNQARSNMTAYEQQLFQDLYGKNADLWRNDRDFKEGQRQFDAELALKKQGGSGGGGGYGGGYRYSYSPGGGSSGGSNPKTSTGLGDLSDVEAALQKGKQDYINSQLKNGGLNNPYGNPNTPKYVPNAGQRAAYNAGKTVGSVGNKASQAVKNGTKQVLNQIKKYF